MMSISPRDRLILTIGVAAVVVIALVALLVYPLSIVRCGLDEAITDRAVGTSPTGIPFDGANVWGTNIALTTGSKP